VARAKLITDEMTAQIRRMEQRLTALEAQSVHPTQTARVGRGILDESWVFKSTSAHTSTGTPHTTDMSLGALDLQAGRRYRVNLDTQLNYGGSFTVWRLWLDVDGSEYALMWVEEAGSDDVNVDSTALWDCPADGVHTFVIRGVRMASTSNMTMQASATNPRWLWLEDVGKAPAET
jgi:hypothetical protein